MIAISGLHLCRQTPLLVGVRCASAILRPNGYVKLLSSSAPLASALGSLLRRSAGSVLDSNSCLSSTRLQTSTVVSSLRQQYSRAASLSSSPPSPYASQTTNRYHYILRAHRLKSPQVPLQRFISRTVPSKMAQIISGKEVADEIRASLKSKVEKLPIKPKLAIVQVGGREDSNVYIRMKVQFAESIGAQAELIKLGRDATEQEVADKVQALNQDTSVHGIITQLPFDTTNTIDSDKIVNMIDPKKDVDGLSIYNAGKLSHGELDGDSFVPCTPNGCMQLIRKSGVKIEGSRSVVIGRSKIVGAPMALLLLWHNSTVTICHSRTENLDEVCRQADIIVAAVGRARMVKKSWLKPGAVVIDCGINVIPDATKKSGTRLVGDVDYDECKEVASAITPVPGGVGPMTVAMLIANTVESASRVAGGQ